MGSIRVHIVMSAEERAQFRAQAAREGQNLSEWLRKAARDRLAASRGQRLSSVDDLDAFFMECDGRETGREPDWDEHLAVIETSRRGGSATT